MGKQWFFLESIQPIDKFLLLLQAPNLLSVKVYVFSLLSLTHYNYFFCLLSSQFALNSAVEPLYFASECVALMHSCLVQIHFVLLTSSRCFTLSSSPSLTPSCSPSISEHLDEPHTPQFLIESPLLSRCGVRVYQSNKDGCETRASIMNV